MTEYIQLPLDLQTPKLCECGCGQPAPIANKTDRSSGRIKGQPQRFVSGHCHPIRIPRPPAPSGPPKLCECGCGLPAPVATQTSTKAGWIAGQPMRFVMGHNRAIRTLERAKANFWSKVNKTEGCWIWTGSHTSNGYGNLRFNRQPYYAHRLSFEWNLGAIPDGLEVLHRCDVRDCVRPDHLFLGTQAENLKDMVAKGRQRRGSRSPRAKLTEDQVSEMRSLFAEGWARKDLASRYGVTFFRVCDIVRGRGWKHVP